MANRRSSRSKKRSSNVRCHKVSPKRRARGKKLAARMMALYGGKRQWVHAMQQAKRDKAAGRGRRGRSARRRR